MKLWKYVKGGKKFKIWTLKTQAQYSINCGIMLLRLHGSGEKNPRAAYKYIHEEMKCVKMHAIDLKMK